MTPLRPRGPAGATPGSPLRPPPPPPPSARDRSADGRGALGGCRRSGTPRSREPLSKWSRWPRGPRLSCEASLRAAPGSSPVSSREALGCCAQQAAAGSHAREKRGGDAPDRVAVPGSSPGSAIAEPQWGRARRGRLSPTPCSQLCAAPGPPAPVAAREPLDPTASGWWPRLGYPPPGAAGWVSCSPSSPGQKPCCGCRIAWERSPQTSAGCWGSCKVSGSLLRGCAGAGWSSSLLPVMMTAALWKTVGWSHHHLVCDCLRERPAQGPQSCL